MNNPALAFIVPLNLFQGPWCRRFPSGQVNTHLAAGWRARRMGSASAEGWTLKQVQGDEIGAWA
jgi:hypothetical protein